MRFANEAEAITYVFRSLRRLRGVDRGPDELSRNTAPTVQLLRATGLLAAVVLDNTAPVHREYAVVTGSKGKGSTTVITAKLLQHLGHTVGMITSPHLVSWRERIRINGRAIPEADLVRILDDLAPEIDTIEATLGDQQYFSPQGIFLAIALRWWDENNVDAAVLEVGRGGRFDDIAVVPNKLALFSPIMLEHTAQLGSTLARIAWHKSGIIKAHSYAYSVPQPTEVLEVLQTEADTQDAEFAWIAPMDMGEFVRKTENGQMMRLGRYGELEISLRGRYQIENATLAVQGAGNMHARLPGIAHGSPEYVEAIRSGLADVNWPGRLQKLQDSPTVYLDGAINEASARSLVESLEGDLHDPVIAIVCVPEDKDFDGVYKEIGLVSDSIIITETTRNISLHFPPFRTAMETALRYHPDITHIPTLAAAVEEAKERAGGDGTILIVGTQSIVADAIELWGFSYEVI
jgi:dihydrofolate synthase / folylpolyglutamate synthase